MENIQQAIKSIYDIGKMKSYFGVYHTYEESCEGKTVRVEVDNAQERIAVKISGVFNADFEKQRAKTLFQTIENFGYESTVSVLVSADETEQTERLLA